MKKDIGDISLTVDIPKTIADFAQMKSMRLSKIQIISLRDNVATIDNKRDLNPQIAAYNKSQQVLEKSGSFTQEKSPPIKVRHEVEIDL